MKNVYILFIGIFLIMYSCGDNVTEELDDSIYGYEYLPLDVGFTWEYQVDSILIIQGGNSNIISSSFVQEKVVELISEESSSKTYRLERSIRSDQDSNWKLRDVWQISKDDTKVIKTEENLRFIKLVFPAVKGVKWDGNTFFDASKLFDVASNEVAIYQDWNYKVEEVEIEKTYNDILYSDVLRLSHVDEESLISRRFSEEYYAKDVGLVYREMEIYDSQNGDTSLSWLERAEKGFKLNQTLLSFSKN